MRLDDWLVRAAANQKALDLHVAAGLEGEEGFDLASTRRDESVSPKLGVLLEAARRATWDALHGPPHLRAGRFRSASTRPSRETSGGAGQQGVVTAGASRRR
jgi:hypothetical protein